MITPDEIVEKAHQRYPSFLSAWLREQPFFPLHFPVGERPKDFADLHLAVHMLLEHTKEQQGYGYTIERRAQKTRDYGMQTLPQRIVIETEQDFLHLIGKQDEFAAFQQNVTLIREQVPDLAEWVLQNPVRVIEQQGNWLSLLAVCVYFAEHPLPNLYIRELPIPIPTKFIEGHRGIVEKLLRQILSADAVKQNAETFEQRFGLREKEMQVVRMRLLDDQFRKWHQLPLSELSMPRSQFHLLHLDGQQCIVTENEMTFLTVPPLPNTFALFGGGFMVNQLGAIEWLTNCPIFYWGDLDAHGFQILSDLRGLFPHVVAVMMDEETLHTFSTFCVRAPSFPTLRLPHLTQKEHALFVRLAEEEMRLEQEHIHHSYAIMKFAELYA